MILHNHFYSSERKLKTEKDRVTIKRSEIEHIPYYIGYLRKEWEIHDYIAESYFACGGNSDYGFNSIHYDITHLVPELIQRFNKNTDRYMFPLFKDILWELARGNRIIYSGTH